MSGFETAWILQASTEESLPEWEKVAEYQRQGAQSWLLNDALTKDISFYPLPVFNIRAAHMSSQEKEEVPFKNN